MPFVPGGQVDVLVAPDHEEPFGAFARLQLAHRVDRVRRAGAAQLAIVEHEARLAVDRQRHHRRAVRGRRRRLRLLPLQAGGQPAHFVEREVVARAARQRQMRVVRRIEGAAEQADAPVQADAQSRGRRKSA